MKPRNLFDVLTEEELNTVGRMSGIGLANFVVELIISCQSKGLTMTDIEDFFKKPDKEDFTKKIMDAIKKANETGEEVPF